MTINKYQTDQELTIIEWGWAKYHDFSLASRLIICWSRRLRQIIDLRDTDKSWYFVITEFNNCFIIQVVLSPSSFSYSNHSLTSQGSDLPFFAQECGSITHEQTIICSKTHLDGTTHEQTIICRRLCAGHRVGFWPMKRKRKMHWMIMQVFRSMYRNIFVCKVCTSSWAALSRPPSENVIG